MNFILQRPMDLLFNATVMVREGLGCVLGFDGLVYTGSESDLCFRPLEPALMSPMYVIWKKYQVFRANPENRVKSPPHCTAVV